MFPSAAEICYADGKSKLVFNLISLHHCTLRLILLLAALPFMQYRRLAWICIENPRRFARHGAYCLDSGWIQAIPRRAIEMSLNFNAEWVRGGVLHWTLEGAGAKHLPENCPSTGLFSFAEWRFDAILTGRCLADSFRVEIFLSGRNFLSFLGSDIQRKSCCILKLHSRGRGVSFCSWNMLRRWQDGGIFNGNMIYSAFTFLRMDGKRAHFSEQMERSCL